METYATVYGAHGDICDRIRSTWRHMRPYTEHMETYVTVYGAHGDILHMLAEELH